MKQSIITGLFLLISLLGFPQGEWNNWYFGQHAGMTFNSGSPVVLPTSAFTQSAALTTTSVSDSMGNFLFYSDGIRVYNKNQTVMPNGFLGITHAVQPSFAVQKINNHDLYYLFTAGEYQWGILTSFRYSLIDMTLQSGLGDVVDTVKNYSLTFWRQRCPTALCNTAPE